MEKLIKLRTPLRRAFTIQCNVVREAFEKRDSNLFTLMKILEDKAERLFKVDSDIMDLCEQEDDIEIQFRESEEYRDQFLSLKTKFSEEGTQFFTTSASTSTANSNIHYKLPKLMLVEYDLSARQWLAFWGQFQRIHEDEAMPREDKFQYLLMCLKKGSKARFLVENFPPTAENYEKAIEQLTSRFGREEYLIEIYTRELIELVVNKAHKLSVLYDSLSSKLKALETLGVTSEKYAAILLPLVESSLPTDVLKLWQRSSVNKSDVNIESATLSPLDALLKFLELEVQNEERVALAQSCFKSVETKSNPVRKQVTAATFLNQVDSKGPPKTVCIFCSMPEHMSESCPTAKDWTVEQRSARVRERGLCFYCLRKGHRSNFCRVPVRCEKCNGHHVTIMCRRPDAVPVNYVGQSTDTIYLKTIVVKVRNKNLEFFVRALLDDGSTRSFITDRLAERLQLVPIGKEVSAHTLFGGQDTGMIDHKVYEVNMGNVDSEFIFRSMMLGNKSICSNIPRVDDPELIQKLRGRGIVLSDVGSDLAPIDILVGSQDLGKLMTGKVEVFPFGVSAIQTKLGWCLLGAVKSKKVAGLVSMCNHVTDKLPNLWDLEAIGIVDAAVHQLKASVLSEAEVHFNANVKFEEGRYNIKLPWLEGHPLLPDHRELARGRLMTMTRRLISNRQFEKYDEVFKEWEEEGIVEKVVTESSRSHYLPHRPVFKDHSSTTKIRPVFDASARGVDGISLNDCLNPGPNLIQEIPSILYRFRMGAVGVTADIRKAFQMIAVNEEDRDYLRFLWWENGTPEEVKMMRHCRVPFGCSSSPFLLNATIRYHLTAFEKGSIENALICQKLKNSFYVDDCICSFPNVEYATAFIEEAKRVMSEAGFILRDWVVSGTSAESKGVLGLIWDPEVDVMKVVIPKVKDMRVTKRNILSLVSRVYDPIGITSAAMITPKLILQDAWRRKLQWDEEIPNDLRERFLNWMHSFSEIKNCVIPRRFHHGDVMEECCQLHIFCDGSGVAYAACAYLRCSYGGQVRVNLVSAKARVGPIEKCTIPRMELLGATIAVRLAVGIREGLKENVKTFYWTDSMVVLGWIQAGGPWTTWVGNRVKEIRDKSESTAWRHVPGNMNPADLPSRGCDFANLHRSQFLLSPSWLLEEELSWPNETCHVAEKVILVQSLEVEPFSVELTKYFSSYEKILRLVGWILRFSFNAKSKERRKGNLTAEELVMAEIIIYRIIQREWPDENRKKSCSSFQVRVDENDLIRLETKLLYGDDPDCFKYPVILPDHLLTRKIVQSHHEKGHTSVQTTLCQLRQQVWVLKARKITREVIHKCIKCKRFTAKVCDPRPSPLPIFRYKLGSCFEVVGVDLAGPLWLKGKTKAWIVLYTCAVYRAIHLEAVTSLSTECFLMSFRRFQARRGTPKMMISDNGSNFVAAAKLFAEASEALAVEKIRWRFNPPTGANFGGFYERLIGLMKVLLRKNLGQALVSYEELVTLIAACEHDVNSRPLTYQMDEAGELRPLTPAHFLSDFNKPDIHEPPSILDKVDRASLLKRVSYRRRLREKLQVRFRDEYIALLVGRNKRTSEVNVKVGDVVLIGADNIKRTLWPLGKVSEIFPGPDGICRVAKLQTVKGEVIRPVNKLYKLEIESLEEVTEPESEPAPVHEPDDAVSPTVPKISLKGRLIKTPIRFLE